MAFKSPFIQVDDGTSLLPTTFSIIEDSTPIDPNDTTGGVGQFTFTVAERTGAKALRKHNLTFVDGAQGTTTGTVSALGGDGVALTVTADSRLVALNVTRSAAPFVGTLTAVLTYYLSLVSITSGIVIDSSLSSINVVLPGWNAVVWDQLKKMCSQYDIEVSLTSNNVVVRPIRQRIAVNTRDAQVAWTLNDSNLAQTIEIYYYQNQQVTNGLVYPLGGWTSGVPIYQVGAGQTLEVDIPLFPNSGEEGAGVSLTSIVQPICVTNVGPHDSNASVYTITGNDGLPVTPAQWNATGGSVSVAINSDDRSIHLTLVGSTLTQNAPYQIAMASGTSNNYSSLRILGSGVFSNKKKLVMDTGHGADAAPQKIGATVENEFINTYHDAIDAGLRTLAAFTGPTQTLNVTTKGINRGSDNSSYTYPTIADFNAQYAGKTIGQFNTTNAGKTIAQFNADQAALVAGSFANQAFGNIAGARVFNDGAWYRIRTATNATGGISYTAERDTTIADFNARYAGMTIGQFNALWAGKTLGDFAVQPLKEA